MSSELMINDVSISASDGDVLQIIQDEANNQDKLPLIPFYLTNNSLCTKIKNKFNTEEFIVDGYNNNLDYKNSSNINVCISKVNNVEICLFKYNDLWSRNSDNFSNGDLYNLFKNISDIINDKIYIKTLIIPPFGGNNRRNPNEVANILINNIINICRENIFRNIRQIKLISPKQLQTFYIIEHINKLLGVCKINDNICNICSENIGTYYFEGCLHAGVCEKCITTNTYNIDGIFKCPYCSKSSLIKLIPNKIIILCECENQKYYIYNICACCILKSCEDCMNTYYGTINNKCNNCGKNVYYFRQIFFMSTQ